jgi:ferredoxin
VGEERETFPHQLYIHPDECIDYRACEPECPWQAIFEEVAVAEVCSDDIALNYLMKDQAVVFKVPPYTKQPHPTADEIEANT